jgi:hypothetical protein
VHEPAHGEHAVEVAEMSEPVVDYESDAMKGAFARGAAKVTPALEQWAKRAKHSVGELAARAKAFHGAASDDVDVPVRRTTAPAPGGGLHAAGRKVVRGDIEEAASTGAHAKSQFTPAKKKYIAAGAIGGIALLAFVALRKPPTPTVATVASAEPVTVVVTAPSAAPAAVSAPAVTMPAETVVAGRDSFPPPPSTFTEDTAPAGRAVPFGNGPVTHGNVLKLHMDGPVRRIQGASQPSGFTVVLPGRKSLDAASPLAAEDPRIAAIHVSNEPSGAELSVTFKDGVPNYQVRANGDVLELHLAKAGRAGDKAPEAHAKKRHVKKHH